MDRESRSESRGWAVFVYEFVSHFGELRLIANHDAKVLIALFTMRSFIFEHGQELMLAQFEKGIAFTFVELLQSKDVDIKCDRCVDIADVDRNMIAAVHLHAHLVTESAPHGKSDAPARTEIRCCSCWLKQTVRTVSDRRNVRSIRSFRF